MENLAEIDCWIFDLDNTLYPASVDLFGQINVKMSNYIMNLLDVDKFAADKMRAIYWEKYGTSLAGLIRNYKVDPDDFLKVVHDIDFSVLCFIRLSCFAIFSLAKSSALFVQSSISVQ